MVKFKKTKEPKIYRTDLLSHRMNVGKEVIVRDLLGAWRKVAKMHSNEQWRLLFETGSVNRMLKTKTGSNLVSTGFVQAIRYQAVGQINSWLSNRKNEFNEIVNKSSLSPETKHQLCFINSWKAWYTKNDLKMKDGQIISLENRKLARRIFKNLIKKNAMPSTKKLAMILDERCMVVSKANKTKTPFIWARMSTLTKGSKINIPLNSYEYYEKRRGERSKSIQIMERDSNIVFGLMTNIHKELKASRESYVAKTEVLALDLGLKTLFASNQGDLLGRGWLDKLKVYDKKITELAAYRQKHGMKVHSPRYKKYVAQLRGFIKSEVNRVLNRLVETHKPAELVLEHLRFQNQDLSRRLNRILGNFGKNVIAQKLKDLNEKYGIIITEVNPAYSSQECSSCHYVAKSNRKSQSVFKCGFCSLKMHADVNPSKNLLTRRSSKIGDIKRHRYEILGEIVNNFNKREVGSRGGASDPRYKNSYFKDWVLPKVTLTDVSLVGR